LVGRRDATTHGKDRWAGRAEPQRRRLDKPRPLRERCRLQAGVPHPRYCPGRGRVPPRPALGVSTPTPSPRATCARMGYGRDRPSRDESCADQQRRLQGPKAGRAGATSIPIKWDVPQDVVVTPQRQRIRCFTLALGHPLTSFFSCSAYGRCSLELPSIRRISRNQWAGATAPTRRAAKESGIVDTPAVWRCCKSIPFSAIGRISSYACFTSITPF